MNYYNNVLFAMYFKFTVMINICDLFALEHFVYHKPIFCDNSWVCFLTKLIGDFSFGYSSRFTLDNMLNPWTDSLDNINVYIKNLFSNKYFCYSFFRMCETGLPSKATEMYLTAAELCEVILILILHQECFVVFF